MIKEALYQWKYFFEITFWSDDESLEGYSYSELDFL